MLIGTWSPDMGEQKHAMLRAFGRAISIQGIGQERSVDYPLGGERTAIPMISIDDRIPLLRLISRGIFKKCVNSQAVYLLSEQHGLEAQERR